MIKHDWNTEAEQGLSRTTDNMHRLRSRVLRGEAELWRVGDSWLVTEIFPNLLWIWTYQGTDFLQTARTLSRTALSNGLHKIGWFTFHKGACRVFRHARPVIESTDVVGEYRFTLNCEDLCELPKNHLIERQRCDQSAVTKPAALWAETTVPA